MAARVFSFEKLAERGGFEPPDGFYTINALAKRRFRPLSHLSEQVSRGKRCLMKVQGGFLIQNGFVSPGSVAEARGFSPFPCGIKPHTTQRLDQLSPSIGRSSSSRHSCTTRSQISRRSNRRGSALSR